MLKKSGETKEKTKLNVVELIVSVGGVIVGLVIAIVLRNDTIAAVVSSITALISIQNLINISRENNNVGHIDGTVKDTGNEIKSLIEVTNKRIHIDELETIEREFCHKEKKNAKIYVVSNNLTMDKTHFLDEMTENIKNGVTYVYVVNVGSLEAANKLKQALNGALNSKKRKKDNEVNIEEKLRIYENDAGFCFAPSKYTLVIYDNGLAEISCGESSGYCCAQDGTKDGIYYFQIAHHNLLEIKGRIDSLISSKNHNKQNKE